MKMSLSVLQELGSSMPLPPTTYLNQYTDEGVKRGRSPRPPPPPALHEVYAMFGVNFHADDAIIRPLESQGIRRLYPQNFDHRRELKKLNHSVLVNFLDLLEIIILSPDSSKRQEKIDDISLLFIHMHHLINEFRPHQARETLRVMMELQKRQTLDTCDRFQKHLEKSLEIIRQSLNTLPEPFDGETNNELTSFRRIRSDRLELSSQDQLMCDIVDSM